MTERSFKRRFQTEITAYFNSSLSTITAYAENPSPTTPPAVPASTQSSLLNVGMRIRKAVPEGYKTKRYDSLPPLSMTTGLHPGGITGYAELVPFCGMVKTGGHDVQYAHQGPRQGILSSGAWHEYDYEGQSLPSSQESVMEGRAAAVGGGLQAGKRRFVDDEEERGEENMPEIDCGTNTSLSAMGALRPIRQASNRRTGGVVPRKIPCEDDFEEANFLQSLDECMDCDSY
ncbi:MAG: hypothetical protein Q9216_001197 [Gyalolechia sp. 2 TL-2023]